MKFFKLTTYALAFLLSAVFFAAHASAATQVYYSVGQTASNLMTGTPTLTISGGSGTFSVAQTGNIGVGDRVTYNGSQIAYISAKTHSDMAHWSLVTATGAPAGDVSGAAVNSITREYTSLAAAEAGATDANHLNTADLVTGNYQLNFPCYYDSGADTTSVVIDGYVTGVDNFIRIYTPASTETEANLSQRHAGKWDDRKYRLESSTYEDFLVSVSMYTKIIGLQISRTTSQTPTAIAVDGNGAVISGNIIKAEGNIEYGGASGIVTGYGVSGVYIYNNLIYGYRKAADGDNYGIYIQTDQNYVYNNTIFNCDVGIMGLYVDGTVLKNNIVQGCEDGYGTIYTTSDFFSVLSAANISDLPSDAPGNNSKNSTTVSFADVLNKDFHLSAHDTAARDSGEDLSGEITGDIDGNSRPAPTGAGWDIGADEGATAVYYSVGQNTTDHKTGSPTLTISGGIGTFSVAQTATNMGVGDKVTYNATSVAYISQKISPTQWKLVTATGGLPAEVSNQTVNSIGHAFSSLSAAEAGAPSLLGTADLVSGNYQLNFPCYYDSGPDTTAVTIDGYATGVSNYIKIYTPSNTTTEVNQSQRHLGKWDDRKYKLEINANYPIYLNSYYVRIEGLQIAMVKSTTGGGGAIHISPNSASSDYRITGNIIKGVFSGTADSGMGITANYNTPKVFIANNVIYGFGYNGSSVMAGVWLGGDLVYIYNNIIYGSRYGIRGVGSSTVLKNNIVSGNTTDYYGTFHASSSNNISYDDTSPNSGGADCGGHSCRNQIVRFVDAANKDFHLAADDTAARNAGVNLQVEPYFAFERDIDGQARDGSWDIGADEFVATRVQEKQAENVFDQQSSLLGHWTFDGADIRGNLVADKSGNGKDGTLTGGTPKMGKLGQGMYFDGSDDHLSMGQAKILNGKSAAAICFWMKYIPASVSADGAVVSAYTPANPGFMVWVDDFGGTTGRQNTLSFVFRSGIDFQLEGSNNLITSGSWDHYCASYQGGSYARIYKNGVLDMERTDNVPAAITDNLNDLEIGWQAGSRILNAELDDIRVYGRALSGAEVGVLYKSGQAQVQTNQKGNADGLSGYWTFENADMSGAVLLDKSGNGNNGTISGAAAALGKLGQGMSFDGIDDYVSIPNPATSFPKTVAYWVKSSALADGVNFGLYLPGGEWMAGGFYGGKYVTGVPDIGAPGSAFAAGEWNHVVVAQQDFETVSVYVNGALVTISGTGDSYGLGGGSSLGRRMGGPYSARFFAGGLDDFRIYDKVLSAEEITRLYKAGSVKIRK